MPRAVKHGRRSKEDAERRAQLQSMFDLFDEDGSGTISLPELLKELRSFGLGKDPKQRARLERHFEFMDKDRSGEVTFEEFVKATLGTANANAFDNLRDEKDSDQFGTDLYMLLSRFRRSQLLKEHEEYCRKGETMNSFATMKKLFATDMFTLSMGGVTRQVIEPSKEKASKSYLHGSPSGRKPNSFSNHYSHFNKSSPSRSAPRRLPTLDASERYQRRLKWMNEESKILYYVPQSSKFVNTLPPHSPISSPGVSYNSSLSTSVSSPSALAAQPLTNPDLLSSGQQRRRVKGLANSQPC